MNKENKILKSLYAVADVEYREFQSALIPTINKKSVIGVRTPVLRKMARDMVKSGEYKDFISRLPHKYFEENQLHAFIISLIKDFNGAVYDVSRFLPYIDNWATCDQMSPKVFIKNADELLPYIKKWIKSKHTFTVRFGVLCLMRYFVDDKFDVKYVDMVAKIKSNEYYVNMMRAWYFATALAKHFDDVLPYLQKLDDWTRGRAIQKSLESYRVTDVHKQKLRSLK